MLCFVIVYGLSYQKKTTKKELFSIQGYLWLIETYWDFEYTQRRIVRNFWILAVKHFTKQGVYQCRYVRMTIKGYSGAGHILFCGIFNWLIFKYLKFLQCSFARFVYIGFDTQIVEIWVWCSSLSTMSTSVFDTLEIKVALWILVKWCCLQCNVYIDFKGSPVLYVLLPDLSLMSMLVLTHI